MPVLDAIELHKSYGASVLLDGASVTLRRGERVGLVGSNGSGKSTLARILAGEEEPDTGQVVRRRGGTVEYLPQEPHLPAGKTILEATLDGLGEWTAVKAKYDELSARLATSASPDAGLLEQQQLAAAEVERLGGWDRSSEARGVLSRLNVDEPERSVDRLSGGERRRVALARLLVARPDLAILDEPTNHLDAETIEWLETYLVEQLPGALLLITHDRYLLDRVVNRTLEIERGQLYSYEGGWEEFLVARAERQALEKRTESNRQNFLRRELEWLRRQPKARTGKQKARIQRAEEAQSGGGPTTSSDSLALRVASKRLGATILEAHDLAVEIGGRRLVEGLTLHLTRGERIGIIGRNGAGKTTLLQCLLGEREPASGRVVQGKNTSFAYFDQGRSGLEPDRSVLDTVTGGRPTLTVGGQTVSSYAYLDRFWLGGDKLRQPVGSLSGGERARVVLAKLLLEPANVLVLDEPTNDLDIDSLELLENMLQDYSGTLLLVSHDRAFLDNVVTQTIAAEGNGRWREYVGGYADWVRQRSQSIAQVARKETIPVAAPEPAPAPAKRKLSYKETRELESLPAEIEKLEAEQSALTQKMCAPDYYLVGPDEMHRDGARAAELEALIAQRMERWISLEEKT